mgnify:FL=1
MSELTEFQLRQKAKIYDDFEKECNRILHMTLNEVRKVFEFDGDMFEEFDQAFEESGSSMMWFLMMHRICSLSLLYNQRELPKDAPWLDLYEHSLTIGVDLRALENGTQKKHPR